MSASAPAARPLPDCRATPVRASFPPAVPWFPLLFLAPSAAFAQDTAAQAQDISWLGVIIGNAGLAGWTVVILSVFCFTIVGKVLIDTNRGTSLPAGLTQQVIDLVDARDYDGAVGALEGNRTFLARVLHGGLSRMNLGREAVERGVESAIDNQLRVYNQMTGYISLVAKLSPMLGLLGTVSGMMDSFAVMAASAGAASPKELAQGIMYALVATFLGLLVSIAANAAYVVARNRIMEVTMEANNQAIDVLEHLYSGEQDDGSGS